MTQSVSAPPLKHLLDTGIVLGYQKCGHLEDLVNAGKKVHLAIMEEVYDELTEPGQNKHEKAAREAKELFDKKILSVCSIQLGSAMAATHTEIRAGKTSATAHIGESASIAFAVHNLEYRFVTNDSAASLLSLQQLRGRTMSFHPFLAMLVEEGALLLRVAEDINGKIPTIKDWSARQPVWWSDWVKQQHLAP